MSIRVSIELVSVTSVMIFIEKSIFVEKFYNRNEKVRRIVVENKFKGEIISLVYCVISLS